MKFKLFFCLMMIGYLFWSPIAYSMQDEQPVAIAFDLHGVVLHYDWQSLAPRLWAFPYKWQVVKNLWHLPFCALIKTIASKPSFEQVLQLLSPTNPALHELLIDLSVQHKVAPDVAVLIQKLHKNGYKVHVLSNIGAESYQRISDRYPDLFGCFSAVTTSAMFDEQGVLIKKPDPRFFTRYLGEQQLHAEQVLFIDDRLRNIEVARGLGMQAIHFKDAEQLQNELKLRNLLLEYY